MQIETETATMDRDVALTLLILNAKRMAFRGWAGAAVQDLKALKRKLDIPSEIELCDNAIAEICKKAA